MNYTEIYYNCVWGSYPKDNYKRKSDLFFAYLMDNNISNSEICRIIAESERKPFLLFDDLPEWLWDNSLLKKNIFYFHHQLRMPCSDPVFDIFSGKTIHNFCIEMKIKYTLEDTLNYIYSHFKFEDFIKDPKKDLGLVKYFIQKYSNKKGIQAIDAFLFLVDYAVDNGCEYLEKITNYEPYALTEYVKHKNLAIANRADMIVWRS